MFSLSEKAAREAHANHREALFEHNRTSLMRIYPYAFRINSSNLDPTFYWRRGAQLVALNWQKPDKGMMLNHGMFVGTHGWRLKPFGYRSSNSPTDIIVRHNLTLSIEVFAAQGLSLPPGDHSEKGFKPYVNCQLHVEEPDGDITPGQDDASSDTEKSSYRRCTKSSVGCNPDFKGQRLEFPTVMGIIEELSFLRLVFLFSEIPPCCFSTPHHIRFQVCRHKTCIVIPENICTFPHHIIMTSGLGICFFQTSHLVTLCIMHYPLLGLGLAGRPVAFRRISSTESYHAYHPMRSTIYKQETNSGLPSFLRFKIKDDEIGRDALAAWACVRLDRLREGYRLIHLHDYAGEKAGGILLVNIVKRVT